MLALFKAQKQKRTKGIKTMGIMRFSYRSETVGRYVDVTVVYPTDYLTIRDDGGKVAANPPERVKKFQYKPGMKFQTVYLMHGGGDDDTLTYRYSNAERFAQEHCVMMVTPNITNSFGVDTAYGVKYQSFLAVELPLIIQTLFASSPKREDNFIMGYAMGGNVALGTAILHPELFASCVDMSGGIGMTLDTEGFKKELAGRDYANGFTLYRTSFGDLDKFDGSDYDLYAAATKNIAEGKQLTDLHIVCGSNEFIRKRVEKDVEILGQIGYPCNYICAEGYEHTFPLWEDYIPYALNNLLPLKNEPIYPED